ncbi:glutamate--cysteine ligase 2 [Pseudonocardia sp. TRM90224]|uniref:glutamate--cysteine ligase 2 n=1 Tax=Pseudonocardia sp. TRM90224 TaxID=2812678 RepID=UPI001E2C7FC8|nr:glutamate--cysteine ligase [Pseudonocardia sp. TRM90224]
MIAPAPAGRATAENTTRSVGVEEEFLLVDPESGKPRAVATAVLRAADGGELTGELQREQVETNTKPRHTLAELHQDLLETRRQARDAARRIGVELAALATSPLPVDPTVSPAPRYRRMVETFGLTGAEQLTCGCHVHVAVDSDEEGVAVLDRIRPWLAPLLAISANSPFWNGEDTGYASFRGQVWGRWPSAGPTDVFGSVETYRATVQGMLHTGTVLDEAMVYFEARLSRQHPTVEIRVADVCRDPADAVLVAGLTRALVETAVHDWKAGTQPDPVPTSVLRLASWRASRSGLDDLLVDPLTWRPAPAADVLRRLVEHAAAALEASGDLPVVRELITDVVGRGTGAARQRAVHARGDGLAAVVADAIA